jgi:hypothetical protein
MVLIALGRCDDLSFGARIRALRVVDSQRVFIGAQTSHSYDTLAQMAVDMLVPWLRDMHTTLCLYDGMSTLLVRC